MSDIKRYQEMLEPRNNIFSKKNILASIELLMVEMTNHFFTSSDFTQEIPLSYLPVFPMTFLLPRLPFLCFFLSKTNMIMNSEVLYTEIKTKKKIWISVCIPVCIEIMTLRAAILSACNFSNSGSWHHHCVA